MSLAPIVIFTFNRLEHTKKTIDSLKKNILAKESEVFIFSDGAQNIEEEKRVKEVREFLQDVDGFKKVTVIESEKNNGLAKSVIGGVSQVINKYGKVIVLEDDLVTSKYFLKYMNEALDIYKKRIDIWSISGYSPEIKSPLGYEHQIYLTYRGCSWGWATWHDRWKLNDWNVSDYDLFKKDSTKKREFNRSGTDLTPMLNDQMKGRINSWAVRWVYNQFMQEKWTVYPTKSFVKNIGNDLSGTHTPITNKYDVEINQKEISLKLDIEKNQEILDSFKKFYDLNLSGCIALGIKKIGLYKQARRFRNFILKFIKRF